jgi:protein-disulfide isomerase
MMPLHTGARLAVSVTDRDHVQGPASAPVTLVEYADYECPYCRQAYQVVSALERDLGAELRLAHRHFPLSNAHRHAALAAEAAEAATAQGKFWQMHDLLFAYPELDEQALLYRAARLDLERFSLELTQHSHARRVREDFMGGVRSGVNGTPTFFINELRHDGAFDFGTLRAAMERALRYA